MHGIILAIGMLGNIMVGCFWSLTISNGNDWGLLTGMAYTSMIIIGQIVAHIIAAKETRK